MAEKAVLIDVSQCIGCRACQVSCKQWNHLPAEIGAGFAGPGYQNPADLSGKTWTIVRFQEAVEKDGRLQWSFRKSQCMHCSEAVCLELCPSSAVTRHALGFVVVDAKRCIGCEVCQKYCPFEVARRDVGTRKLAKCTFCIDRVANGEQTACAKACPTGAVSFGDRAALLARAHQAESASEGKLRLYGENEMGGLHVLYLLPGRPLEYGLPEEPRMPDPYDVLAFLQDSLKGSPHGTEIMALAALKYFSHLNA